MGFADTQSPAESGFATYKRVLWQEPDPKPCDGLYPASDPGKADAECDLRKSHMRDVHGAQLFWSDRNGMLIDYALRVWD